MKLTRNDIITLPNPKLRQTSQRVGFIDDAVRELAEAMIAASLDWEASREHEAAAALAAVQVGRLERVVVVRNDFEDHDNKSFSVFINPEIVKTIGDPVEQWEGCLSVKDLYGLVPRYKKVKVKAQNLNGQEVRLTATDFLAQVFQHEVDHTNGIVFTDHVHDEAKLRKITNKGDLENVKGL